MKSFWIDVFGSISNTLDVDKQLGTALFGVAAVNINGAILCSILGIPIEF